MIGHKEKRRNHQSGSSKRKTETYVFRGSSLMYQQNPIGLLVWLRPIRPQPYMQVANACPHLFVVFVITNFSFATHDSF